jgi:hypothetical protein
MAEAKEVVAACLSRRIDESCERARRMRATAG